LSGGVIAGYTNGVEIAGGPGTVINAGSIIGTNNDGVLLSGGGSVSNATGGTILGGADGIQISGGPGTVVNAGSIIGSNGTAILLDPGTYSNSVTLQTGSYVQGNIVGGAGFDAAILQGTGSYASNFLNFETLTVQANATGWNLTGSNAFSTNAVVESGLLRINGSLITPLLTVDQSWTGGSLDTPLLTNIDILASDTNGLGGSGIIIGNVNNNGYISPGNSIGTLTIIGSYTNGGNYYAEVTNTGASDHVAISGTAAIKSGNVIVEPFDPTFDPQHGNAGIYAVQTKYTILTASNGVSGMYVTSSVVIPTWTQSALFPLVGSSLFYDPNNVYLYLYRTPFTSVAKTFNQNAVAGALDGVGVTGLSPTMASLINQFYWLGSAAQAQQALDSMSGEIHGTMGMLDVQQQGVFNNLMAQRTGRISANTQSGDFATGWTPVLLASTSSTVPPAQTMQKKQPYEPLDLWVQGVGSFGRLNDDGNAIGGNFVVSGMGGGLDYRVTPEILLGLCAGYSHDDADVDGPGASGTVNAYQIGAYGGYIKGPWHLDGILSYGYLHTDTTRFIDVGTINQQANGSYDGGVFSVSTEGGYAFKFNWLTAEPTIGLDYAHMWQDSFSETGTASDGNNYGLNVNSVKMDSLRSSVGAKLAAQFGKMNGVQYLPGLRAVWEHEFIDRYALVNANFIGGSPDFNVRGVELGADTADLGAGLTIAFNRTIQTFINYDANINERIKFSTISGGLSISW
jgi:uncharacterized protein with beta-barrel porin domain